MKRQTSSGLWLRRDLLLNMSDSLLVPARFNGPQESGNGGYVCGALAEQLGGAAEVSLRSPVPLDTPLEISKGDDGVRALDGDTLVAEGSAAADFDLEVPAPVSVEEARLASAHYRGKVDGEFSHCFVCGKGREDGFDVFAGEVEGRGVVATPWIPPPWAANEDGNVRPEFVWAVLDCPTYFATYNDAEELPLAFLARLTARIDAPVRAGAEHVVIAWPIGADGRKRSAGSAVLSAEGEVLASAQALLIEPRAS
jgi:hypothetical protein